jgi:hypothetical protein
MKWHQIFAVSVSSMVILTWPFMLVLFVGMWVPYGSTFALFSTPVAIVLALGLWPIAAATDRRLMLLPACAAIMTATFWSVNWQCSVPLVLFGLLCVLPSRVLLYAGAAWVQVASLWMFVEHTPYDRVFLQHWADWLGVLHSACVWAPAVVLDRGLHETRRRSASPTA